MSLLNQGRNEIRFNNSGGKCLLENWVEERAVKEIVPDNANSNVASAQGFKDGHQGILSTAFNAKPEKLTTFTDSYRKPVKPDVRQIGRKTELMQQMFFEKVSQEVHDEFNPPPPEADFRSVTMADFNKPDFVSIKPKPTANHDYRTDQPVSFWSEHRDRATGVTQVKTRDTVFRKNDGFSKPISEYWDEPQPYELENYPKM
ncbi:sperm-associated antigen 8-like [Haliotis asinina]|uniref:sperm-associated antigen 8-like n=1 Tax=Haliotis asinina TaxID=109174 RepID=UPI0035321352